MKPRIIAALVGLSNLLSPPVDAAKFEVAAKAVADVQLRTGSSDNTVEVLSKESLEGFLVTKEEATTLKDQLGNLIADICHELDLRNPGPAFLIVDDSLREGFSALDTSTVPSSLWPYKHAGVILIGSNFTGRLLGVGSTRGSGLRVAIAHELAHIYQFRSGVWPRLLALENDKSRKRAELHADFLAGWLSYKLSYSTLNEIDVSSRQLFDLGDKAVLDPNHHGTSAQRYAAVLRGFFMGVSEPNKKIKEVSLSGEEFINSLVPLASEKN